LGWETLVSSSGAIPHRKGVSTPYIFVDTPQKYPPRGIDYNGFPWTTIDGKKPETLD
jgi:hypothetical protein